MKRAPQDLHAEIQRITEPDKMGANEALAWLDELMTLLESDIEALKNEVGEEGTDAPTGGHAYDGVWDGDEVREGES